MTFLGGAGAEAMVSVRLWLVSPIHNDEAGPVSQRTVE